jgi:hypothetical protein
LLLGVDRDNAPPTLWLGGHRDAADATMRATEGFFATYKRFTPPERKPEEVLTAIHKFVKSVRFRLVRAGLAWQKKPAVAQRTDRSTHLR